MVQSKIILLANRILDNKIGIAVGCREMHNLLHTQNLAEDSDFSIFKLLDSESDEFPMGQERDKWDKDVLKKKDTARNEMEDFYRNDVINACKKIIEKFNK